VLFRGVLGGATGARTALQQRLSAAGRVVLAIPNDKWNEAAIQVLRTARGQVLRTANLAGSPLLVWLPTFAPALPRRDREIRIIGWGGDGSVALAQKDMALALARA